MRGSKTSLLFSKATLGGTSSSTGSSTLLSLANRLVVAPMCQYSASTAGEAQDWHLMHWGQLLNSGAGLVILEATGVVPEGRITPKCLGLWDDATESALADKLSRARALAPAAIPPKVFIQLAHAGRKGSSAPPWEGGQLLQEGGRWQTVAPSAIPQLAHETPPHALTSSDLARLTQAFVASARRALRVGVDGIELHAAHGYLLHQFLSPLSNQRTDCYGGSFENRIRYPLELFRELRGSVDCVLGVRLSATDWVEGQGWTPEETVELSARLKELGCDYVHVSSGGISPLQKIQLGPGYQVPFARQVKTSTGLPTMAVGLITDPHQAEAILQDGDADFVALARAFLWKPRWGWQAAAALGATVDASPQFWRCLPREAQAIFGDVKVGQR